MLPSRGKPEAVVPAAPPDQEAPQPPGPAALRETRREARGKLLRSSLAVGVVTLLSRITGLIREAIHSHYLGTGAAADAFRIAFLIPNVLRRLVGEGAISAAFVPVFARAVERESPEEVRDFAERFFTLWGLVLVAITLVGMALAGWALGSLVALGASWTPEKLALTARLTWWLFPYLVLIGLAAAAGGVLNAFGIFALPSATPLLFNLAFIASGLILGSFLGGEEGAAMAFSMGVLAGGSLQLLVLLPPLWKRGIGLRPRWKGGHAGVREVLRLLIPATFGAGIYQINVLVSTFLAMRIPGEGAVAALGYAGRLMEFVLGVFVFGISTVSLTTLSRQAAGGDREGFRTTLLEVLGLTSFITIPSAVGLYLLREPVITLILRTGRFDEHSARLTAEAFQEYVPGLVLVGLTRVLVSAFYALKDIWTPVRLAVVNLLVNAVLAWMLMGELGHAGIARAATLSALVQAVCLLGAFLRRQPDLLRPATLLASLGRAGLAALVLAAVCQALLPLLPGAGASKVVQAAAVAGAILAGAGAYLAASAVLRSPEVGLLVGAFARRLRRR